jgi:hypothetical protein
MFSGIDLRISCILFLVFDCRILRWELFPRLFIVGPFGFDFFAGCSEYAALPVGQR